MHLEKIIEDKKKKLDHCETDIIKNIDKFREFKEATESHIGSISENYHTKKFDKWESDTLTTEDQTVHDYLLSYQSDIITGEFTKYEENNENCEDNSIIKYPDNFLNDKCVVEYIDKENQLARELLSKYFNKDTSSVAEKNVRHCSSFNLANTDLKNNTGDLKSKYVFVKTSDKCEQACLTPSDMYIFFDNFNENVMKINNSVKFVKQYNYRKKKYWDSCSNITLPTKKNFKNKFGNPIRKKSRNYFKNISAINHIFSNEKIIASRKQLNVRTENMQFIDTTQIPTDSETNKILFKNDSKNLEREYSLDEVNVWSSTLLPDCFSNMKSVYTYNCLENVYPNKSRSRFLTLPNKKSKINVSGNLVVKLLDSGSHLKISEDEYKAWLKQNNFIKYSNYPTSNISLNGIVRSSSQKIFNCNLEHFPHRQSNVNNAELYQMYLYQRSASDFIFTPECNKFLDVDYELTPEKVESEEEDGLENESESSENIEDCEQRKTIKVKPVGGPLLAQTEISNSQQDFFKMLDEKIQNGPDYNSESEAERAAETARLRALLKDWETASAGSRSLPVTPKRRPPTIMARVDGVRSADIAREMPRAPERAYVSQIPQSIIHQSYGITQVAYRQVNYNNPNYISQSPSHQIAYPSAMQYQAISPMYTSQPTYQPPPPRQYPSYNQHGSPIKTYVNNSPKHIPYDQPNYSPTHKLYGPPVTAAAKPAYTNGELLQQQIFSHHAMQYQQYKEAREQVLAQHQQQTVYNRGPPRNYQSSVTIPIVVKSSQQNEMNSLHRKQYELT